jgi:hypothetical protein
MTRRKILSAGAAILAGVLGMASAAAAGSGVGLLEADDLPGYEHAGAPLTADTSNEIVVDHDACSQGLAPISGLETVVTVQFVVPETGETALSEAVTTFPTAKAARASFTKRSADAAAAIACDQVDVLNEGATVATLVYEKVKVAKIGERSAAWQVRPAADSAAPASTIIVFHSGTHVVFVNSFGNEGSPTLRELKKIARLAARRLQD